MKKLMTAALALVIFAGAANAQDQKEKKHRGHGREKAIHSLNLSDDQKAKIKNIRESQKEEILELQKNDQMTVADMKEKRKALHNKYQVQFKSVLTAEQLQQLESRKGEMKERARDGNGKRKGAAGKRGGFAPESAFFKKELNLSADQESRLKSIFQEFRTKAQTLRTNNNLTQDQKKEEFKNLSQSYINQGKAVLNAEQLQKLEAAKSEQKNKRTKDV